MTSAQLPLAERQHRNHQLFSDHYLNVVLPTIPAWKMLSVDAGQLQQQVRAIFARFTPSSNEQQIEHELIRPVLELLGHTFEVQASLRTPRGTKKPDYMLYNDAAARQANKDQVLTDAVLAGRAFGVAEAKYWDRALDVSERVRSGDPELNRVPADQIAFYMLHAGVEWGILTNGRLWRLYHKDTAQKQDRYYEVDLQLLAEHGTADDFCFFYAFFHRSAFEPGPLSLHALLQASTEYARGISESIKLQVYDALRHIAQGFLDYPANNLASTPENLKQIYDSTLIVLYRLLFILYAESRELLPLRTSKGYREEYSLEAIKQEAANRKTKGSALLATTGRTWIKLKELFGIINAGSPPLKVATFNGGLFDPNKHTFLERYSVGDAHLQEAIDRLARVDGQFIDYRDLAERHLGTIYEGLLEQHLQPIVPESGWTIDLFDSSGERHKTGSYYTPDFAVQYIIDQTIGPTLDAAVAGCETDAQKIAAVLDINVLDPAMGSGHFPVAAMEYIARYLVNLGVMPEADAGGEADLLYWKRRVAQSCIYGVDLNPLAVDLAKLSLWLATAASDRPLSFLDHHLRCGNALIGSRISDLGAGQAKKKTKKAVPEGQISLLDDEAFVRSMGAAVGSMAQIEASHGNTIAEVREQEQLYAELRAELTQRYQAQADLATAMRFGLEVDTTLLTGLRGYLSKPGGFEVPQYAAVLRDVGRLAGEQRFFHYDLEFPEVFFDHAGQPLGDRAGFDVVIGNPPYVRQEYLAPIKDYLAAAYPETYHGMADLYVFFYQQGLRLLSQGGRLSYIVTNKWLRAGYGAGLRGFFASNGVVEEIIDFGHAPIFPDADVFPCIVVVRREQATDGEETEVCLFPREALGQTSIASYVRQSSYRVPARRFTAQPWSLERGEIDQLMEKVRRVGVPLVEYLGAKPYRGVLTGFNEAFLIDTATKEHLIREDPRSAEIIKPYLRGQDIKRWAPAWVGLWMIFTRRGIDIDAYPAIKHHLLQFREQLEPRPENWVEGAWPGRKPGPYKWYEIQDTVGYHALFNQPKIFYQEIQFHPSYCLDESGYLANNKVFLLPQQDYWLLAVLNSPLMWWYNWRYLPHMKDEALNPVGALMEQLPIVRPSDEIRAQAEHAAGRLIVLTQQQRQAEQDMVEWLRVEFDVDTPGQKLASFVDLNLEAFTEEVRKRRPKATGRLNPAALRDLRQGYTQQAAPLLAAQQEAQRLERQLANLVNAAYGLTPEEVALLWATAPPRMPFVKPGL